MNRGAADGLGVEDTLGALLGRGINDLVVVRGLVVAQLFGEDGRIRQEERSENLILTAGRNMIVDRLLASPTLGVPTHMGVGTGTVAPAVGDTTMTAEVRVALTSKTRATNVLTLVGDWAAGQATQANTEAGVWDAATAGTLLSRATFAAINKGASDTLKVTWTWTIG